MNIYEQQTFQINNITDIRLVRKKFPNKLINILHDYNSIKWQGPNYVKALIKKFKKKEINYIVDLNDNIGLILTLINSQVSAIAISEKIKKQTLKKILSIAKDNNVEILYSKKLRIEKI